MANPNKTVEYLVNGKLETVLIPMTDEEVIEGRKLQLELLVALGTASARDKSELALLK